MDDPPREIEGVIRQLTQTQPSAQRTAVNKYFTSDAEFIHPFCRTGSFDGSRFLIQTIYRWYKIMSPRIDLNINSIAYDDRNLVLYVNISQTFKIFIVPFYRADVTLTTVLRLRRASNQKYYIASQNDLYQVNEFVKFFTWPFGFLVVLAWQFFATIVCLLAAVTFWPISWLEEHGGEVKYEANQDARQVEKRLRDAFDKKETENGEMVTAPVTGA